MGARIRISDMPFWPRFLSREESAAYVGVSVGLFDDEVSAGKWPPGMRRGKKDGRITWDRVALDRAADHHSGLGAGPEEDDEVERGLGVWQP